MDQKDVGENTALLGVLGFSRQFLHAGTVSGGGGPLSLCADGRRADDRQQPKQQYRQKNGIFRYTALSGRRAATGSCGLCGWEALCWCKTAIPAGVALGIVVTWSTVRRASASWLPACLRICRVFGVSLPGIPCAGALYRSTHRSSRRRRSGEAGVPGITTSCRLRRRGKACEHPPCSQHPLFKDSRRTGIASRRTEQEEPSADDRLLCHQYHSLSGLFHLRGLYAPGIKTPATLHPRHFHRFQQSKPHRRSIPRRADRGDGRRQAGVRAQLSL